MLDWPNPPIHHRDIKCAINPIFSPAETIFSTFWRTPSLHNHDASCSTSSFGLLEESIKVSETCLNDVWSAILMEIQLSASTPIFLSHPLKMGVDAIICISMNIAPGAVSLHFEVFTTHSDRSEKESTSFSLWVWRYSGFQNVLQRGFCSRHT